MRSRSSISLKLAAGFTVASCSFSEFSVDPIRIDPSTGNYVDRHGRTRIFHGMNVVYKEWPWVPSVETFSPTDSLDSESMDNLRSWGFNVVRLGVMWPGVEPTHKQIDSKYLQAVVNLSEGLARREIYTIADLHQDLGSRYFCGEGFPEFYVEALLQNKSSRLAKGSSFPGPFMSKMALNASGFPSLDDCLKKDFASYYATDSVGALFAELYTPGTDLHKGFLRYWGSVASAFQHAPQLLAYELINEPSGLCLGDTVLNCYDAAKLVFSDDVEKNKLTPLYQAAAQVIRDAGSQQPIFYEPTVAPKVGPAPLFPTPPLGNDTQQALAYHIYCAPGDGDGAVADLACKATQNLFEHSYFPFLRRHKSIAGFMTEFGAVGDSPGEFKHLQRLLRSVEGAFQSWTYWMLKKYNDFTTANAAESLYFPNGTLEVAKLKVLSRTYARAIGGVPQHTTFDPATAAFQLSFIASVTDAPTEVYLNEELHYPDGFVVDLQPANCLIQKIQAEKNYLHFDLQQNSSCRGSLVQISITAKASSAQSTQQVFV